MITKKEFIARKDKEQMERIKKLRSERFLKESPMQQRVLEKMGIRLKVKQP